MWQCLTDTASTICEMATHILGRMLGRTPYTDKWHLANDLCTIRDKITNQKQFALYANRAWQLRGKHEGSGRIRSRELLKLARQLKDRLNQCPLDSSLACHNTCKEIIKEEFQHLNALKLRSTAEQTKDEGDERAAIDQDLEALERLIQQMTSANQATPLRELIIRSMDDVTLQPIRITERYTQYSEVVRHLRKHHDIEEAEIWVRRENQHTWTKSGYRWFPVDNPEPIGDCTLDFISAKHRALYVVVLVDQGGDEFPVALDIKRQGTSEECCTPRCGNLENHLEAVWPTRDVRFAYKIDAPNDDSVAILGRVFDTSSLIKYTHQLCFKCWPRP